MIWLVIALVVIQAATVAAFLVAGDRRDKRHHSQLEAERTERRELYQRIQAPDVAVAQAVHDDSPSPGALDLYDDAAYHEHILNG